jgi:hypothetical protein
VTGVRNAKSARGGASGKNGRIAKTGWIVTLKMSGSRKRAARDRPLKNSFAGTAFKMGINGWVNRDFSWVLI